MCTISKGYNIRMNKTEKMKRKIADKFFNNSATSEETKRVLEWVVYK